MKRLTAFLIVTGASLFAIAPPADAHDRTVVSRHYAITIHRDAPMPLWLHRHHDFRRWYLHSTLRGNRHLDWWQLYEIYRWELRYRAHRPAYHAHRHHGYDWYRRYWRDYERKRIHRDDRHERRHDRRHDRRTPRRRR